MYKVTLPSHGRLFLVDMLLGNPDRLPCEALAWRGNPANVLWAMGGVHAHRLVAIDSAVQRRPPGACQTLCSGSRLAHCLSLI